MSRFDDVARGRRGVVVWMLLWAFLYPSVGKAVEEYRIAPGDLISIKVFGEPDLSLDRARVASNGAISFPLLGEVRVEGLTARQLEQKLTALLKDGYLKKPEVSVAILEYRPFYINGAVASPGSYGYQEGLTVEKAIALAGGLTKEADRSRISVVREGGRDKKPVTATPRTPVYPGDVVNIGRLDSSNKVFYVHGEVRRPGAYPYREGMTVGKAVALAGGLTKRASKRKISIMREGENGQARIRGTMDSAIQPGDVIDIGQSIF